MINHPERQRFAQQNQVESNQSQLPLMLQLVTRPDVPDVHTDARLHYLSIYTCLKHELCQSYDVRDGMRSGGACKSI